MEIGVFGFFLCVVSLSGIREIWNLAVNIYGFCIIEAKI